MVPEDTYSPSYLREEPLDKSYDFISHCATHGYHIRWAGLGAGLGRGRGGAGSHSHHLALTAALPARPCSAATPPLPSPSSITTGLGLVAATKWVPRAPRVSPSGASVPAVLMSLAVTALAALLATGASRTAGVSTSVCGRLRGGMAPHPNGSSWWRRAHRLRRVIWSLVDQPLRLVYRALGICGPGSKIFQKVMGPGQ